MTTPEPAGSLLSRVTQLVRKPGDEDATASRTPEADTPQASRDAFRQMLARKQHNDEVRRREFAKLRQIRRQAAARAVGLPQPEVKPTALIDSELPDDLHEREETLKKIDDIEAQMSRQWWKSHVNPAQGTPATTGDTTGAPAPGAAAAPSQASSSAPASDAQGSGDTTAQDDMPTVMGLVSEPVSPPRPAHNPLRVVQPLPAAHDDADPSGADETLEEAAIRFATGDDGVAEECLLAALRRSDTTAAQAKVWTQALLELYSATQQRARFESLAASVAQRFGFRAPAWSAWNTSPAATPSAERAERIPPAGGVAPAPGTWTWVCPARLDGPALATLRQELGQRRAQAVLDWAALEHITDAAGQTLAAWVARWCETASGVLFANAQTLDGVLAAHTVLGDAQVPRWWWQLRLDCLRLCAQRAAFEQLALDFCVTYEISPPSWQDPQSQDLVLPSAAPQASATAPAAFRIELPPAPGPRLHGALRGDISSVLVPLERARSDNGLNVDCSGLQRLDFSAAGGLLAWAAQLQAQGCAVALRDVSILVGAFMRVVGIHEHALICTRDLF
ncbi:MAG: hypothetical protein OHK0048_11220 [Rhodoferax sp.]